MVKKKKGIPLPFHSHRHRQERKIYLIPQLKDESQQGNETREKKGGEKKEKGKGTRKVRRRKESFSLLTLRLPFHSNTCHFRLPFFSLVIAFLSAKKNSLLAISTKFRALIN